MADGEQSTGKTETPKDPTPPQIDSGMVKEAIREILGEIPEFKTLISGGTPATGGSAGTQPSGKPNNNGLVLPRMTWRSSRGQPPAISTEHSGGNVTVQLLFMRAFPLVGLGIMPSLAALAGLPSLGHSSTQSDPTPSPGDGTSKGASDTPPRTSGSSILITNLLPFVGDSLKISSDQTSWPQRSAGENLGSSFQNSGP